MDFSLAGLSGLSSSIEKVGLGRVTAHGEGDTVDDDEEWAPSLVVPVLGVVMDMRWSSFSSDGSSKEDEVEGEAQVESGVVSVVLIVAA